AVGVGRAKRAEQVQRGLHRLGVLQVPGDDADAVGRSRLDLRGDRVQRLVPRGNAQLAVFTNVGLVQTLAGQTVDRIAALVRQPLFVDALVQARQHAHDLGPARIGADVRTQGVHDVDGL